MVHKRLRRAFLSVALAGMAAFVPAMSGCDTAHPNAEITIEFNGVTYTLEYVLYRNMYPQTVRHFIELAGSGFYDNTLIHDYQSSYWYGGGYTYSETEYNSAWAEGEPGLREYIEKYSKEKTYYDLATAGKLTASVYKEWNEVQGYTGALPSLIGEFGNQHKIENGALTSSYGALRMYYTSKDIDDGTYVYLDKEGSADGVIGEYENNSATSLFSIQLSSSTSSDSSYCIFAKLQDTDVLNDLTDAISDYIDDDTTVTTSSFTESAEVYVDNYDEYVGKQVNTKTYKLTKVALIVKSVKITKY